MTAQDYKDVAADLEELFRQYPIADDPRIFRLATEMRETAKVRARDLKLEEDHGRTPTRLKYGH